MTAALLLTLTSAPDYAGQKETETVDRTVPMGASGHLKLKNFSGDIRISGTTGNELVLHAVRRATRDRLENIQLDIVTSGSSVTIDANKRAPGWRDKNDNVVETSFDIKVPFGTTLDLYSFSGKIDVSGVHGRINAETFSGNVMLDVASAAELPTLTGETFSGNIQVKVRDNASGRVEFDTFSGDVETDLPIAMRSNRRRDVKGEIGSGGNAMLKFKTFSGDLRIRKS